MLKAEMDSTSDDHARLWGKWDSSISDSTKEVILCLRPNFQLQGNWFQMNRRFGQKAECRGAGK